MEQEIRVGKLNEVLVTDRKERFDQREHLLQNFVSVDYFQLTLI
jgi:hypothetical protein